MLNLSELKNELIGFEGSCLELDNKLVGLEFYSEIDVITEELIDSECIYYVSKENTDEGITLDFKVTVEAGEDEVVSASEIKVIDIR